MRFIASLLPVGIGLSLARRYRRISERKKRRSVVRGGGSRFYTIEEGVRQLIQTKPIDMVLCGHIHDFADRKMEVGDRQCRVVTTGAWEEGPNYAVLNGDGLCLHRFEPAAKPAAPLV